MSASVIRCLRGAALGLATAVEVMGCTTVAMDKDEPCRQVGFSIAARTHACTGNSELANHRYEAFVEEYRCLVENPLVPSFDCAVHVNSSTCEQALSASDDLDTWLDSPACVGILIHKNGKPAGKPHIETPSQNPNCQAVIAGLGEKMMSCEAIWDAPGIAAWVDTLYICLAPYDPAEPMPPAVGECLLVTSQPCQGEGNDNTFEFWLARGGPACEGLFQRRTP